MNVADIARGLAREYGDDFAREAIHLAKRILDRRRRIATTQARTAEDRYAAERKREIIRDAGNGE